MSATEPPPSSPGLVFETIMARRVTREFADSPVPEAHIHLVLEAARWAPSGGGRRLNVYIVVCHPENIRKLRAVSPGILGHPQAVIVICIDQAKAQRFAFDDREHGSFYVDLGTAAENMLLAAQELRLGACPVMSFHRRAVQVLLDLPSTLEPAMMILLGYPAPPIHSQKRPRLRLPRIEEVTHLERYTEK